MRLIARSKLRESEGKVGEVIECKTEEMKDRSTERERGEEEEEEEN